MNFRDRIQQGPLIGDGAMATLLHQFGVPARACFEELSQSRPEMIRDVHKAYIQAGAEWIQTNTFSGHRVGLERYGFSTRVRDINRAAAQVAREAARDKAVFVFGTVGSTSDLGVHEWGTERGRNALRDVFSEQLEALIEGGVDGVLLETFADLDELLVALEVTRNLTDLPVIANLSPDTIGVTRDGYPIDDAFKAMHLAGADVVGLNCRLGLAGILRTYEKLSLDADVTYSAVPNAGMLHYVDGEYSYTAADDYFAEVGVSLARKGVGVLGGCCGTTPNHIQKLAQKLREVDIEPPTNGESTRAVRGTVGVRGEARVVPPIEVRRAVPGPTEVRPVQVHPIEVPVTEGLALEQLGAGQRRVAGPTIPYSVVDSVRAGVTVVVELDPPRTLDATKYLFGAQVLKDAGADVITLADNSLGTVRISNMALAALLKQQGIEPLAHVTCRDRNLIGQQSHLMGLHVLGIHNILLVTGDPSRFGDLPGATSVYDVSSIELSKMVKKLNTGVGFSGQALRKPAKFVVGTSFNPNVTHFDKALERLQRKIDAGADYVMTQPIFDIRHFERIARAVEPYQVPVFIGIMPMTSSRNAQFLHHEVPGIDIPEWLRKRMDTETVEEAGRVGIEIAKTLLDEAMLHFRGIYLVTPFLRYDLTAELTRYVKHATTATGTKVQRSAYP